MSQLLDSLRKTHRAGHTVGRALQPSRLESVLTSMGFGRAPRRWRGPVKVVAGVVAVAALSAFTWTLNPNRLSGSPRSEVPASSSPIGIRRSGAAQPETPPAETIAPPAAARPQPGHAQPLQPEPKDAQSARTPIEDFRRAVRHHEAGDLDRATALYQSLLARDALPAQVHNNLGLVHQARGNFDEAAREFEQALMHDPNYAKAHNNFGVLLLARHRVEAAISSFRAASLADPTDIDPLINLALAQKAGELPDQAAETLLAALGVSPHSAPAHYNLAVLYDGSGERARAVEHYRAFLEHRGSAYASQAADVQARLAALDSAR